MFTYPRILRFAHPSKAPIGAHPDLDVQPSPAPHRRGGHDTCGGNCERASSNVSSIRRAPTMCLTAAGSLSVPRTSEI
jgi:hypothetical protein